MTLDELFDGHRLAALLQLTQRATEADVRRVLAKERHDVQDFALLLSEAAGRQLEALARAARRVSLLRWGRAVQLYAPLYVSNACSQVCTYCAFRRDNDIVRRTLTVSEVAAEADALLASGIRHILLVSGEHKREVSLEYLVSLARALHPKVPSLSVEVAPQEEAGYRRLVAAGIEGLVLYQETYDRVVYAEVHRAGRKRNYDWRLAAPDRGAAAGMRHLGIGVLLGLSDWRRELLHLGLHAQWLMRRHWQTALTVSLPRLRKASGAIEAPRPVADRDLTQAICALRLFLPDLGLVLSTREPARLRHGLVPLGITHMSAGSRTEPGGYTAPAAAEQQFAIDDHRSPDEVAAALRRQGYDVLWKDWDSIMTGTT